MSCAVSMAGTSSFVVIHGPNAPVWAKFLPEVIWAVCRCQSRTEASLKHE